jgi:hypothetical protein
LGFGVLVAFEVREARLFPVFGEAQAFLGLLFGGSSLLVSKVKQYERNRLHEGETNDSCCFFLFVSLGDGLSCNLFHRGVFGDEMRYCQ